MRKIKPCQILSRGPQVISRAEKPRSAPVLGETLRHFTSRLEDPRSRPMTFNRMPPRAPGYRELRPRARGLLHELLHQPPFAGANSNQSRTAKNREAPQLGRISDTRTPMRVQKLVGGPGFEPGASRSRTLRPSVQKRSKRSLSDRFLLLSQPLRPDLSRSSVGLHMKCYMTVLHRIGA